jgi:hypothetical protein
MIAPFRPSALLPPSDEDAPGWAAAWATLAEETVHLVTLHHRYACHTATSHPSHATAPRHAYPPRHTPRHSWLPAWHSPRLACHCGAFLTMPRRACAAARRSGQPPSRRLCYRSCCSTLRWRRWRKSLSFPSTWYGKRLCWAILYCRLKITETTTKTGSGQT